MSLHWKIVAGALLALSVLVTLIYDDIQTDRAIKGLLGRAPQSNKSP